MSTGKRLAKRSILGTRVACCLEDGKYYPAIICDIKNHEEGGPSVYSVRVEGDRRPRDLREGDLVGSGFTPVGSIKLRAEQKVYITHNSREVRGSVIYHRPNIDEVLISLINPETNTPQEIKKRLEEVRLLESRKSARLADQDTDFARLADCSSERINRKISSTIDVPGSFTNGSRKRRGSRSEDDLTDECAAALVLMKLSCSPRSPAMHEGLLTGECFSGASSASSGMWSWSSAHNAPSRSPNEVRSVTPSPPLFDSSTPPPSSTDDGIDMEEPFYDDDISPRKRRSSTRVMFKCTWRDCSEMASSCPSIEQHIRTQHLGLGLKSDSDADAEDNDDDDDDHEEEFYWTEIEVNVATLVESPSEQPAPLSPPVVLHRPPVFTHVVSPHIHTAVPVSHTSPFTGFPFMTQPKGSPPQGFNTSHFTLVSSPPTLSHMDMARPPHEDPEYRRQYASSILSSSWPRNPSYLISSHRGGKSRGVGVTKTGTGRGKRSGESRKCRKVYGMDQKDQWCTQCKWKKACSRFSE